MMQPAWDADGGIRRMPRLGMGWVRLVVRPCVTCRPGDVTVGFLLSGGSCLFVWNSTVYSVDITRGGEVGTVDSSDLCFIA